MTQESQVLLQHQDYICSSFYHNIDLNTQQKNLDAVMQPENRKMCKFHTAINGHQRTEKILIKS